MPAAAGSDTRLIYRWEDDASGNPNFAGSPTDTDWKTFGYNARVNERAFGNNPVDLFDPGSREAAEKIAQMFDGTWGVEFTLSNPWFWKAVISNPTSSGSAPTTHTFDGSVPFPMQIRLPIETSGNESTLKGAVVATCSVDVGDNGTADVSLTGAYADETEDTPASITAQDVESFDGLTFADGSFTADATTYSLVQNVSFTLNTGIEVKSELGSRFAVTYIPKVVDISAEFGKLVEDDSVLLQSYGGSGTSPASRVDDSDSFAADLTFDNGKTGSAQNKQIINLEGAFPAEYSRSGTGDPTADYVENQTLSPDAANVVATNASASAR